MIRNLAHSVWRRPGLRLLPLGLLIVVAAGSGPGCREKDTIVGPPGDTTDPGEWRLVLDTPDVMYRGAVGHVENDTIVVRLYDSLGVLRSNIRIRSRAAISPDSIAESVFSRRDTVAAPWGCEPALIYWGSGGIDGHEIIVSYAVRNDDTLAQAQATFKVVDGARPQ